MKRAIPHRNLRRALRYWKPYRLTLPHNPPIYAWLWWNYKLNSLVKWIWFGLLVLPHPRSWKLYIHLAKDEWKWRGVEYWHRY